MTGRVGSTREPSSAPSTARILLFGAVALALGATVVLVMSDDSRFLKLGIVAALWSALVGAFLAQRYRRQVTDGGDDAASMQAIYELELEREIAARREYELELEAEAKRTAEEASRQDIDALRKELGALRETLQGLLGGEVLVERFALQAEATRMRSLPEESRPMVRQSQMKRITASPAASSANSAEIVIPAEAQTELMERVLDRHQPRRESRPPTQRQQRPAPREPQRPSREVERQQVQVRQQRPAAQDDRFDPGDPGSGWWEPVTPPGRDAPRQPVQEPTVYHRPLPGDSDTSLGEGLEVDWTPSWERDPAPKPQPQAQPDRPRQQAGRPQKAKEVAAAQNSRPLPRPQQAEPPTRVQSALPPPSRAAKLPPPPPPSIPAMQPVDESGGRRRAPEPGSDTGGGRRRAPETGAHEVPDAGGGRRRRADDQPSWQESLPTTGVTRQTGSHAKPAPTEPTGSHAEGKSVSELLAAHANTESPRRRRRRED
jgi:hypothetical protein